MFILRIFFAFFLSSTFFNPDGTSDEEFHVFKSSNSDAKWIVLHLKAASVEVEIKKKKAKVMEAPKPKNGHGF